MKFLFQVIGFLLVLIIVLFAVLFFLQSMDMLKGDLADYIANMRNLWTLAYKATVGFLQKTGISESAANLLSQAADSLRGASSTQQDYYAVPTSIPVYFSPAN